MEAKVIIGQISDEGLAPVKSKCGLRTENERSGRAIVPVMPTTGTLVRLKEMPELYYERHEEGQSSYRDNVCELCCRLVCLSMAVPLDSLHRKTRSTANIAFARQVAMYLCHTTFSILLTEIGLHFKRDRTTVSHACQLVESRRDDPQFDDMIVELEALLNEAQQAIGHSYDLGWASAFSGLPNQEG